MAYVSLSSAPVDERCAQLGAEFYNDDSLAECHAYRAQLARMYPFAKTKGVQIVIKAFPHEFGEYRELVAKYDEKNVVARTLAFSMESQLPQFWDVAALQAIATQLTSMLAADRTPCPWMATEVVEVQQGRNLVELIRKQRRGFAPTPNEILAYLTPECI